MKFTEIPEKLKYPPKVKAQLSTLHSDVITYVIHNFRRTAEYRQKVLSVMNTLTYLVVNGDTIPRNWSASMPFKNLDILDDFMLKEFLGELYLYDKHINWDVNESEVSVMSNTKPINTKLNSTSPDSKPSIADVLTPKEHLYINSPQVPRFDINRPWRTGKLNGSNYTIYESLPTVPTRQNEISITTDVERMTYANLMQLYPNHRIATRANVMYDRVPGLEYDDVVGVILPIDGFTSEQVRDNIIRYPHFFKLKKCIDNEISTFYKTLEIDGELHDTMAVWDTLPESAKIPRTAEFIKEYVVRRYLLERDIKHTKHNYPMFGSLDPFLTLFTTSDEYIELGYSDTESIAIQCVRSRIAYKQSRNPILRRWNSV